MLEEPGCFPVRSNPARASPGHFKIFNGFIQIPNSLKMPGKLNRNLIRLIIVNLFQILTDGFMIVSSFNLVKMIV